MDTQKKKPQINLGLLTDKERRILQAMENRLSDKHVAMALFEHARRIHPWFNLDRSERAEPSILAVFMANASRRYGIARDKAAPITNHNVEILDHLRVGEREFIEGLAEARDAQRPRTVEVRRNPSKMWRGGITKTPNENPLKPQSKLTTKIMAGLKRQGEGKRTIDYGPRAKGAVPALPLVPDMARWRADKVSAFLKGFGITIPPSNLHGIDRERIKRHLEIFRRLSTNHPGRKILWDNIKKPPKLAGEPTAINPSKPPGYHAPPAVGDASNPAPKLPAEIPVSSKTRKGPIEDLGPSPDRNSPDYMPWLFKALNIGVQFDRMILAGVDEKILFPNLSTYCSLQQALRKDPKNRGKRIIWDHPSEEPRLEE